MSRRRTVENSASVSTRLNGLISRVEAIERRLRVEAPPAVPPVQGPPAVPPVQARPPSAEPIAQEPSVAPAPEVLIPGNMVEILTAEWKFEGEEITPEVVLKELEPYLVGDPDVSTIMMGQNKWITSVYPPPPKEGETQPSDVPKEYYLTKLLTGILPSTALVVVQYAISPNFIKEVKNALSGIELEDLDDNKPGQWEYTFGPNDSAFILMDTSPEKGLQESILAVAHIRTGISPAKTLVHELYDIRIRKEQPKTHFKTLITLIRNELLIQSEFGIYYTTASNGFLRPVNGPIPQVEIDMQKNSLLWIGCEANGNSDFITVLFYEAIGFYFPGYLPGFLSMSGTTPLGRAYNLRFLNGYMMEEPTFKRFLSSNTSQFMKVQINKEDVRELIGDPDKRDGALEDWGELDAPNEKAGMFYGPGRPGGIMEKHSTVVDGPPGAHDRGGCQVLIPDIQTPRDNLRFTWHSHPMTCHRSTGFLSGFPSEPDYAAHLYHFFDKVEDGHFVFSREGVFIMQVHPALKDSVLNDEANTDSMKSTIEGFLAYLKRIGYTDKRIGSDPRSRELSQKLLSGQPFTEEEVDFIFENDDGVIGTLIGDVMAFTTMLGGTEVPLVYFQVIRRGLFSSTNTDPATFFTCRQVLYSTTPASTPRVSLPVSNVDDDDEYSLLMGN
jgi:hypothetical protein